MGEVWNCGTRTWKRDRLCHSLASRSAGQPFSVDLAATQPIEDFLSNILMVSGIKWCLVIDELLYAGREG